MNPPHDPLQESDAAFAANIEGSSIEFPVSTVLRTDERVLAESLTAFTGSRGQRYEN